MPGFECDCSQDADWYYAEWATFERVSDGTVVCSECGETIAAGKPYQLGTGVAEDDYPEDDDFDNAEFTEFCTCIGCQRIADRFCGGDRYVLGNLVEAVSHCLGFDYHEDPADWDQTDVDTEDKTNRELVLALIAKRQQVESNHDMPTI